MVRAGRFQKCRYNRVFIGILTLTLFFHCSYVFAAEQGGASGLARYRVLALKHIPAEKGKEFLAEAQIGTVSQLPGGNALLVTAQHRELIKASAILRLVDSKESFVFKTIYAASELEDMPSNEQIAAELGDVSIGTFLEMPEDGRKAKAIIDIHNGAVIAVAPARQFERIIAAVKKLRQTGVKRPPATELVEPQPAGPDTSEPFGRLLDLLAEAEKKTEKFVEPRKPAARDAALQKSPQIEPLKSERVPIEPAVAEKEAPGEVPEMVYTPRSYAPNYGRIAEKELELDLDLPEQLNIVDLMRLVGEYLELDYMYDPAKVKGTVTLKLRGPIKVKDLYPLLESVLKFKGFVMARKINLVTIVPAAEAAAIDPAFVDDETGQPRLGDVIITRIFRLKHIGTTSAKNLLESMGLGVNINTSLSEAKTLIVTGFAYRMGRIEELLQMIDKPGRQKQFRFRQLRYTVAEKLAPKIKTLADELGTVLITVSAAPAKPAAKPIRGRRATPKPKPPTTAEPTKPTVYLDTDERTNRILMIGLDEQLNMVEALIDMLDVEQQDLRTLRLYEIQHVGAEEVIDKLGAIGIISGTGTTTARRPTTTRARTVPGKKPAAPRTGAAAKEELTEEPQVVLIESTNSLLVNATAEQHARIAVIIGYVDVEPEEASIPYVIYPLENQNPEELAGVLNQLILETTTKEDKSGKIVETQTQKRRMEEDIVIIPDPVTYSLIVYASKRNQQWISSLIKQLDQYRPQVLLDVTLVEITKNEKFDLDLDAEVFSGLPILSLSSTTGAIGGKSVTAFYKSKDVHVFLEALQEKGYGRILARPKLLVNDNEEGTIKSEEQTSVAEIRTIIIPGTGVSSATASQDVTFKSYSAGITLTITPHISKGDQLGLSITLTRSDFRLRDPTNITTKVDEKQETSSFPTPPDLLTSDVTTNVTVPDGATIILGGLERIRQSKGGTKVPLLGDIPFIGGLFRTTSNQDDQSRLYVFVRATIIRPGEEVTGVSDIEMVSAKNRATFEKYEAEMQQYEDWPGIKPKPMDPLKILEIK